MGDALGRSDGLTRLGPTITFGAAGRARAVYRGGRFRPVVVVDGWVVSTWTHDRDKRRSAIRAVPSEALDAASQRRLEEAADIGRFLGEETRVEVATAGWVPGGVGSGLLVATLLMILLRRRCPRWWFDFARGLTCDSLYQRRGALALLGGPTASG